MIANSFIFAGTGFLAQIGDHLWQSTLFACAAGACAIALRNSQARVRYWLWLAASLKFLVPFALLAAIGSQLAGPRVAPAPAATVYSAVIQAGQPFTSASMGAGAAHPARAAQTALRLLPQLLCALWLCGAFVILLSWAVRWRRVWAAVRVASVRSAGREVDALRAAESVVQLRRPIPLLESPDSLEPGVFGVLRPVLIWPAGISSHLEDSHLTAILAHEVTHVRRRDNLAAAVHMFVEAVFWFHPLVWWLGAKLVEERELACDEAVLRLGSAPGDYAESILMACKFCVESPLACVAGVSGSNLKRRIVHIMNRQPGSNLSFGGKLLLASLGAAAISTPVAIGFLNPSQIRAEEGQHGALAAPTFDVKSVRANHTGGTETMFEVTPDSITINNMTAKHLIEMAYGLKDYQLSGGPSWIDTERFDIEAMPTTPGFRKDAVETTFVKTHKIVNDSNGEPGDEHAPRLVLDVNEGTGPRTQIEPVQATLRSILSTRFNLKMKEGTQSLPVYVLTVGDGGVKAAPYPEPKPAPDGNGVYMKDRVEFKIGQGSLNLIGGKVPSLAQQLGQMLEHPVIDKTGLTARYDLNLHWKPSEDEFSSISEALEDQLGLRLEQQQAPTSTFEVEQIDMPSQN